MGMQNLGIIRALSQFVSRAGLASNFGHRFGGLRDYYTAFGYKTELTYNDMLLKYVRQGIASRIVDAPAQSLWDNPPIITSENDDWNNAWNKLVNDKRLWETILRVDKLAGLGRYSCLFIGVDDVNSAVNPPRKPRSDGRLRNVLHMQAYSQQTANIAEINNDSSTEQFMLPDMYDIYPFRQDGAGVESRIGGTLPAFKAHHSRVLHVAENTLENSVFGLPRLERVFNDLDDMLKVSGGTAETYWLTSNRGMQVDIDKDIELTPEDAADLSEELDEYMHQLRRFIRTRGVEITNLGAEVPSPEQTFNMLVSLISGSTGIPRRILIGAEAGQLASEQDRANWAERVKARRKEFGEPVIIHPLIAKLTILGALPPNVPYTIDWPDAYILSPFERAQKAAQIARSATNLAKAIETIHKLNKDTQAIEPALDEEGNPIPGTGQEGEEGAGLEQIATIEEVRAILEIDRLLPINATSNTLQDRNDPR